MNAQLKLGLACIVVALVLLVTACTPAKAEDMKPGAVCYTTQEVDKMQRFFFTNGKETGHQLGGQAAVDELLGHFHAMCAAYQSIVGNDKPSAPTVELRNGIRIQCAK